MAYMKKFKTSPSATALDIYAKLADKDAHGKDIDTYVAGGTLVGTDLSLYDGQVNPVSTIDLSGIGGGDTFYNVVIQYVDTSVYGNYANLFDVMAAETGTWSIFNISPSLPAGTTLSDFLDHVIFSVQVTFPNADLGYQHSTLYNTVTGETHPIFFIPKLNVTGETVGCVTLNVNGADQTVTCLEFTSFSSGSGSSAPAILGQIASWPSSPYWSVSRSDIPVSDQIGCVVDGGATVWASAMGIDNNGYYFSTFEEFVNMIHPASGASFTLVIWLFANVNIIRKVTAQCEWNGDGTFDVQNASMMSASSIGA